MIYPPSFEAKLGFDRIREMLSELCLCGLGRIEAEAMSFSNQFDILTHELLLTHEMRSILLIEEHFPQENYIDCTPSLRKMETIGSFIEIEELSNLRKSMVTINNLSRYFTSESIKEKYPNICREFRDLKLFPEITKRIDRIIDNHGMVKDNASPELRDIRGKIRQRQTDVNRKLHSILRKAQQDGLVNQDVEISLRDGRPVIPVIASNKRKLSGLVHDESASGKTAFIEPQAVVELNNELRELSYAERREIVKILVAFADEIRPEIPDLMDMYQQLGRIDFLQAKGRLAIRINAGKPILNRERRLEWRKAVHPLLFLSHKKDNKEVVPLDIKLDEESRILIISGPNAGGKSVCLKSVGLLQYMVQCGLLVSMGENSEVCLFDHIFLDIGDEQSLENDLSTYSSHLQNMKNFLRHSDAKSLVLIDEFGTGTEPALGGAIAEAVLEELNTRKTFGVITTHYSNLKHYASEHPGTINGAMLFDTQKIKPLYKLSIGEPGSSFAIDIARNIGLPEEILSKASEIVGEDYVNFEKHLRDIIRDKKYWEEKRQRIRSVEKSLEGIYSKYQSELDEIQKERKTLLKSAKQEAEAMLKDANKAIERTIREIKESNAEKERTRLAREKLEEEKHHIRSDEEEEHSNLEKKLKEVEKAKQRLYKHNPEMRPAKKKQKAARSNQQPDKIEIGDKVRMIDLGQTGEVVEINSDQYIISMGNMLTTVARNKLEKAEGGKQKPKSGGKAIVKTNFKERKFNFKSEIDVRGKRADEALQIVRDFIDDAVMMNARHLQILHGKGNGILRQLIRDYLSTVNDVSRYNDAHIEMGGAGITVVELR